MTLTQYRRMCVFALRMVKLQPRRYRSNCRYWVREMLYRMSCKNYGIYYPHIIDWDHSESHTDEEIAAAPWKLCTRKASYLCDYLKAHNGMGEQEPELSRERPDKHGDCETVLLTCVTVCIRAACDVAVAPSAGVVGYTCGDLRKMWGQSPLPKWACDFFSEDITNAKDEEAIWL